MPVPLKLYDLCRDVVLPGKTFEVDDSSQTPSMSITLFTFLKRVEIALDGLLDVGHVIVLCSVDACASSQKHAHNGC